MGDLPVSSKGCGGGYRGALCRPGYLRVRDQSALTWKVALRTPAAGAAPVFMSMTFRSKDGEVLEVVLRAVRMSM